MTASSASAPSAPVLVQVVVCSTRPTRIGPKLADWFLRTAGQPEGVQLELVDLADFALPVFDEPEHPRLGKYAHEHTKRWSATVARAQAFVFVTPEYNYGPPPALVNALNYLSREWNYKPVGFVSYGGISGGLRGVQVAKQIVTTLRMVPVLEAVVAPFAQAQVDASGSFVGNELQNASVAPLLAELRRVAQALAPLRG